jgi:hypothetical protein
MLIAVLFELPLFCRVGLLVFIPAASRFRTLW